MVMNGRIKSNVDPNYINHNTSGRFKFSAFSKILGITLIGLSITYLQPDASLWPFSQTGKTKFACTLGIIFAALAGCLPCDTSCFLLRQTGQVLNTVSVNVTPIKLQYTCRGGLGFILGLQTLNAQMLGSSFLYIFLLYFLFFIVVWGSLSVSLILQCLSRQPPSLSMSQCLFLTYLLGGVLCFPVCLSCVVWPHLS